MNEHAAVDHAALAESMPIEDINVSDPKLYQQDVWMHYFRRLRRDAPVHYCKDSPIGPYWSVTRWEDIMYVDTHPALFSSDWRYGGITLFDPPPGEQLPMFIAMDPPQHDEQRKAVQPIVAPGNLPHFEALIRQRPRFIRLMGDAQPLRVQRIVREPLADERSSRDYDFSADAIRANADAGHRQARRTLGATAQAADPGS